jgi:hypothetical protein
MIMRRSQDLTPPDVITTRLDGWIGSPGHIPLAVAELIARAIPQPADDTVAAIRRRMYARHKKVLGHD